MLNKKRMADKAADKATMATPAESATATPAAAAADTPELPAKTEL